jgi:glycosyltransferase involved in cell wall biosynthesis
MSHRILYIHHARPTGGSAVSLLYLLNALDSQQYEPIVACLSPDAVAFYEQHGFRAVGASDIGIFGHTTGGWGHLGKWSDIQRMYREYTGFRSSIRRTCQLVEKIAPDLVHLNSLTLVPSAIGVKQCNVPLVWHVRESVHSGYLGLRRWWIRRLFVKLADRAIFISEDDRQRLTGGKKGIVIPNFVDFSYFDATIKSEIRTELGIPPEARVILYLGGYNRIKGIFPLIEALPQVKQAIPQIQVIAPGMRWAFHYEKEWKQKIRVFLAAAGVKSKGYKAQKLYVSQHMSSYVHALPWRSDVPELLAACDVLVFPSVEPHFARPVIEAGAMRKPVVASRIGGVSELVEDGITGFLCPPGDANELAGKLIRILSDQTLAENMGTAGYRRAHQHFDAAKNIQAIQNVYNELL